MSEETFIGDSGDADTDALEFQTRLFKFFRRIDPWEFSQIASIQLARSGGSTAEFASSESHFILQAIEACLALSVPTFVKPHVDWDDLTSALNIYHEFTPHTALESEYSVDPAFEFIEAIKWQQYPPQEKYGKEHLGRAILLYKKGNPLPKAAAWFEHNIGLTIDDWFLLNFFVYAQTHGMVAKGRPSIFTKRSILAQQIPRLDKMNLDAYLGCSSRNQSWFKSTFNEKRSGKSSPSLHWQIRPSLLENPIIDFGSRGFLVPNPNFILRNSWSGLHRILSPCREFANEFSHSFERYVGSILSLMRKDSKVIGPKEVKTLVTGKSADFILEFDDCVLVVECKASEYSNDIRTRNALASSNFIRKIGRGMPQIIETISSLKNSGFLGRRICLGIVVTLGDTFHPNAQEFRQMIVDQVGNQEVARRLNDIEFQVMPIRILEQFVAAILHLKKSPLDLFEDKKINPYRGYGDWSWFLTKELKLDMKALLSLLTPPMDAAERFFSEIDD